MIDVRVQAADFDPGAQLQRLSELGAAAVSSFIGIVEAGSNVTGVTIEHYAAAAKNELSRIAAEAEARWELGGVILIHRHGSLAAGDRILFAAAASSDPAISREACSFLIEALRTRAPFWRKDLFADGTCRWM